LIANDPPIVSPKKPTPDKENSEVCDYEGALKELKKVTDIDSYNLSFENALGELRNVHRPKEVIESFGKGWSSSA
jgi:hypothetical protein